MSPNLRCLVGIEFVRFSLLVQLVWADPITAVAHRLPIKQEHQRSFRGRGPVIKEFRSGLFVVGTVSKPQSDPATRRPLQVQAKRLPLQQSTLQIFFLCLRSQFRPRSLMALVFFVFTNSSNDLDQMKKTIGLETPSEKFKFCLLSRANPT